jgi:hypothetical protein
MTVSTTDISVLHYIEVAHFYPQVVFPFRLGLYGPLNTSKASWRGHTTRPLQSSTSIWKTRYNFRQRRYMNPSYEKSSQHDL